MRTERVQKKSVLTACLVSSAILLGACASQPQPAPEPAATSPEDAAAAFDALVEEYIAAYLEATPPRATSLGVHDYDDRLPDMTQAGREAWLTKNRAWLLALGQIPREALDEVRRFDHQILEHQLRGTLLEIEQVRGWEKNPRIYNAVAAWSVSSLADRAFAPMDERLANLSARLGGFEAHFAAARANLKASEVPPLWVELALNGTKGTITFLRENLMQALEAQGYADADPQVRQEFETARADAIATVEAFRAWMESDLQPAAAGDFRLGPEVFEKKLLYDEFFDLTCDELEVMNEKAIAFYKDWVARVAAEVDPDRAPADVMAEITEDFPSPEQLISTAEALVVDAQAFVKENEIIPLPSEKLPTVRPTPEYRRMSFASMESPGPFETAVQEAFYNITNVDPEWDAERQKQHLTYFNYPGLLGISVHEAMPGHYVHGLYKQQSPSKLRQIFVPASLSEGWAHYVEQMMLDEGFGGGDPKVRLGQLRRALQRHARWHAGVQMHCFGETVEDAAERFQEIAYFAEFPALRETQRGTYNPTYLYYALGRIEILRIRDALKEKQGDAFDLGEFHRNLLVRGLPIPLFEEWAMSHSKTGEL